MSKVILKMLVLLTMLLHYCITPIIAQTYEGHYIIKTAEDTLNFNYTKIEGDLLINKTDLIHFTGFSSLIEIGGNLKVIDNDQLE